MAIKRITTNLIKDSDIATVDIANNAITAAKITDGNITTAKLADLSVTAGKLAGTLDLTGKTITVATATTGDSDTSPASTAFVQQEIAALVDSSPSSLNTLNELAAALGDDASFSTTVTNSIATKLPLAGGTMTGDLKVGATIASTGGTTNSRGMLLAHQNNTNQSYVGRSENGVADTGNRITFDYDNDKMQLDSDGDIVLTPTSNVGIGTTSPNTLLTMQDNSTVDGSLLTIKNQYRVSTTTADTMGGIAFSAWRDVSSSASYCAAIYAKNTGYPGTSGNLIFATRTNGNTDPYDVAERMRIDPSGNVGIGGSPTNYSDHKTLSLYGNTGTGAGFIEFNDTSGNADAVIFSDNGNLFINADYDNTTADSSIRFRVDGSSEKMRISSAGDIRMNTIGQMGNATLTVKAYTSTNTGIMLQEYDTSNAYGLYTVTTDDSFRITRFVSGAYSDRLIIDSNGSFGINTSSLSNEASLYIGKQPTAGNAEGGQLVLQSSVNGSKAIHIDNYNNASVDYCRFMRGSDTGSEAVLGVWDITNTRFGIGTATPLQTLTVAGSAWATGYYITALQGNSQLTNASTSSGSNPSYIGQGLISVTVSDAKAKENFGSVETNECLNKIVSLSEHVKKFDWIDEDWKKQKGRTVGMVAQEIYEDHSEFVNRPENYDDDGWAIRYQEIVPTLVKAIQELKTELDTAKARITELEG